MSNLLTNSQAEVMILSRSLDASNQHFDTTGQFGGDFDETIQNNDGTKSLFRFQDGLLTYSETTDANGNKSNIYNINHNKETGEWYTSLDTDGDGVLDYTFQNEIDENGNEISSDIFDNCGLSYHNEYVYNDMGQLISDTGSFWDPDGSHYSEWSYKYCYDESGNVIKDEYDDDNDGTIDTIRTYEYDEYSRILKESIDHKSNDNIGFFGKILNSTKKILGKPVVMDEVKTYEYSSKYDSSKGLGTEKSREYCYLK